MTSKPRRSSHGGRKSSTVSRTSTQTDRTEVVINIYDLLPPGRLSSVLWTIGGSLLHSGVVINNREYAYGGHNRRNTTGVYFTRPRFEPPGGTFRGSILHGVSFRTVAEVEQIIHEVSQEFMGPGYNLLSHNCNHFTSTLCYRLTGKAAPAWLNRAASIGVALPCVVPKDWVTPPDCDTADGELVEEEEDEGTSDETQAMLASRRSRQEQRGRQGHEEVHDSDEGEGQSLGGGKRLYRDNTPPPRLISLKDSSGRDLPTAERAPLPKRSSTFS